MQIDCQVLDNTLYNANRLSQVLDNLFGTVEYTA